MYGVLQLKVDGNLAVNIMNMSAELLSWLYFCCVLRSRDGDLLFRLTDDATSNS